MYESPISITERIAHEIAKEKENQVFKAIAQIVVDVDEEEIIKALKYDREQYEKGYRDGLEAAVVHAHWNFECVELNGGHKLYTCCSNCCDAVDDDTPYCPNCGAKMDEEVIK